MTAPNWAPCRISLGQLKPWAANPRLSTKAQAKRILASFAKFGQVLPVAIGPDNEVYDGHQRLSALLTVHGPEYEIDARRSSRPLTDDERRALVVTLHAGAVGAWNWDDLAGWDAAALGEWGMDAQALKQWNTDAAALAAMLEAEKPAPVDAEPQIDRAEELRAKWGVEPGQLWKLGEHRLICGDCTDAGTVALVMGEDKARLLFTDPPYGVSYADKNVFLNAIGRPNSVEKDIEADHQTPEQMSLFWKAAFTAVRKFMEPGAAYYITGPQGGDLLLLLLALRESGFPLRHMIIWAKNQFVIGRSDYHYQHEPVIYGWVEGAAHTFVGGRGEASLWQIDKPRNSDDHPTMKPIELYERGIRNSTEAGAIVLEPFSGSGTAILACERLGRRCRAVEISPAYVAVALDRWAAATGGTPELVEA